MMLVMSSCSEVALPARFLQVETDWLLPRGQLTLHPPSGYNPMFLTFRHLRRRKSPLHPPTSNVMGNTPSNINSPKLKISPISRSSPSTTSTSSQYMPGAETPRPLRDTGEKGSKLQPGPVVHALPAEPGTHIVKAEAVRYSVDVQSESSVYSVQDDPQLDGDALKEPEMNMSNKNGMYSAGTDTPRPAIKQQYEEAENLLCDLPSGPAGGEVQRVDDVRTSESAPSGWIPGTYVLINARSGTALDLQIGDQRSLIGFPMHGGPNQQWEFVPSGQGYMIRSALSVSRAEGLYLTVEDGIRDHAAVVASAFPVSWNVNQNEEGIIISWPNTDFVFGLADMGSSTPGTEVQLVKAKPGEPCQLWNYARCAPARQGREVKTARGASRPLVTESVALSDGRDYITTTRTTTTTTVTTVTEITKTPRLPRASVVSF